MSLPFFKLCFSALQFLTCRWRSRSNVVCNCALALFVGALSQAPALAGDRTQYIVDGLALGDLVHPNSSVYREYRCSPSEQFTSFIWCKRSRLSGTSLGMSNQLTPSFILKMTRQFMFPDTSIQLSLGLEM